jgi:predicted dehydrogenase
MTYTVAIVGTGPGETESGEPGYETTEYSPSSRGYAHAQRYEAIDGCEVVACADVVPEHGERFVEAFGLPAERAFTDYAEMLDAVEPDVVGVCTPPTVREDIVTDCAAADSVDAIHCEKPLAHTPGGCHRTVEAADAEGVQLSVHHQQRMSESAQRIRALVDSGEVGEVRRVEGSREDLAEAGIHQVDLCNYFNGDHGVEWVLGGLDYSRERIKKGVHNETQTVAIWEYANGVHAVWESMPKGEGANKLTGGAIDTNNRIVGTDAVIERPNADRFRIRRWEDGEWEEVDCTGNDNDQRAITEAIEALEEGREPDISGHNVLPASELVFGIRESSRRRGRVEFPVDLDEDPLAEMVEAGELTPEPDPED